jgi:hypothetical protein
VTPSKPWPAGSIARSAGSTSSGGQQLTPTARTEAYAVARRQPAGCRGDREPHRNGGAERVELCDNGIHLDEGREGLDRERIDPGVEQGGQALVVVSSQELVGLRAAQAAGQVVVTGVLRAVGP